MESCSGAHVSTRITSTIGSYLVFANSSRQSVLPKKDAVGRRLMKEFIEAVKQHIAASADVNAKIVSGSIKGDTPTDYAEDETAELLRKHGGNRGEELKAEGN